MIVNIILNKYNITRETTHVIEFTHAFTKCDTLKKSKRNWNEFGVRPTE